MLMIVAGLAAAAVPSTYADMFRAEGKPPYVVASGALDDCLVATAEFLRGSRMSNVERYVAFFSSCRDERRDALRLRLEARDADGRFGDAVSRHATSKAANEILDERYEMLGVRALDPQPPVDGRGVPIPVLRVGK